MFTGEYKHTVDAKNRLSIPAKFREKLGKSFYMTKGLDNCLFVFPEKEWEQFAEELRRLPMANPQARAINRAFLSSAVECELDKQGRILLPQLHRSFANIDKEVYVNGAGTRVEIWDSSKWESYNMMMTNDMDALAADMSALGISF